MFEKLPDKDQLLKTPQKKEGFGSQQKKTSISHEKRARRIVKKGSKTTKQ